MVEIAPEDRANFIALRANVDRFLATEGQRLDAVGLRVLDIAPQDHRGAAPHFPRSMVATLDMDPTTEPTFVADLCQRNVDVIASGSFDVVVCTEVLEHTLDPFAAVAEIGRILTPGGTALVSTPFNFRIHGPLPDCWRFTEHGLRALFAGWPVVAISALESPDRALMPIHYTTVAQSPMTHA